jgi:hypothetical protein
VAPGVSGLLSYEDFVHEKWSWTLHCNLQPPKNLN